MDIFRKHQFTRSTSKTKNIQKYIPFQIYCLCAVSVVLATMVFSPAFAAVDPNSIIVNVINFVFKIARAIGAIFLVWGFIQLFLAFKNEDSDSKSRAVMTVLVGVFLVGIEGIFTTVVGDPSSLL